MLGFATVSKIVICLYFIKILNLNELLTAVHTTQVNEEVSFTIVENILKCQESRADSRLGNEHRSL